MRQILIEVGIVFLEFSKAVFAIIPIFCPAKSAAQKNFSFYQAYGGGF